MIDLVKKYRNKIHALCKRQRVEKLELFGSATDASFDPDRSDLDFLVEFLPLKTGQHADAYFGLLFGLEDLFNRKIDLAMPSAIRNPYLLEAINKQRRVLYAARSPSLFARHARGSRTNSKFHRRKKSEAIQP
jgi:uncharacterized protein